MAVAFVEAVAQAPTIVPPPAEDFTLASELPAALTAPVVDEATVLHGTAPVVIAGTKKRGKLPWWAWALIALLVIGVGVWALRLVFGGGDEEPTIIATQGDVEAEPGDEAVAAAPEDAAAEFEDEVNDLSDLPDYREVRPCDWTRHGPGLCIYDRHGNQPVRKLLQDEGLEGIALPSWSPDGAEIVFSAMPKGGNPHSDFTLYRVRADGTELTKLPQLVNDLYPDWSPDGEWFAFHSGCNLAVIHPNGLGQKMLWDHVESDREELPVKIGQRIVGHCDDTEPPQLCVREVETDRIFQITSELDFALIHGMTWSPDGELVVFDGGRDGEPHDLYVVNVHNSEVWPLTDNDDNESCRSGRPPVSGLHFIATVVCG